MRLRYRSLWTAAIFVVAACGAGPVADGNADVAKDASYGQPMSDANRSVEIGGGGEAGPADQMAIVQGSGGTYLAAIDSRESAPECPPPPGGIIVTPAQPIQQLELVNEWIEVPLDLLVGAMFEAQPHSRINGLVLGSALPRGLDDLLAASSVVALRRDSNAFSEWIFHNRMDELLAERAASTALVALEETGMDGVGFITMVVLEEGDGSFTLVGSCGYGDTVRAVSEYADGSGFTDHAMLLTLATDDVALEAFGARDDVAVTAWIDRPPRGRQIDIEMTPADVLDGLDLGFVVIDDPPMSWHDFDEALCSFVALGWGPCTAFYASEPGEPIELDLYFDPGGRIEIWLLDEKARLTEPIVQLGVFEATHVEDGELHLSVSGTWASVEELISAAERGEPVFTLAHS